MALFGTLMSGPIALRLGWNMCRRSGGVSTQLSMGLSSLGVSSAKRWRGDPSFTFLGRITP